MAGFIKDDNTIILMKFDDPKNPYKDECGNTWYPNTSTPEEDGMYLSPKNAKTGMALQLYPKDQDHPVYLTSDDVKNSKFGKSTNAKDTDCGDFTLEAYIHAERYCNNISDTQIKILFDSTSVYTSSSNTTSRGCFYIHVRRSSKISLGSLGYYYAKGAYQELENGTNYFDKTLHFAFCFTDKYNTIVNGKQKTVSKLDIFENGKLSLTVNELKITKVQRQYFRIGASLIYRDYSVCNENARVFVGSIDNLRLSDIVRYTEDFDPEELLKEKFNIETIRYVYPKISYDRKIRRIVTDDQEQRNRYIRCYEYR